VIAIRSRTLVLAEGHHVKSHIAIVVTVAALTSAACGGGSSSSPSPQPGASTLSFFVSSATSTTGNLGGLRGADAICQNLATPVGAGSKTWRAYLSVEHDPDNGNGPTNARSRIGNGPWVNAAGVTVASGLTALHARKGDPAVFVDERETNPRRFFESLGGRLPDRRLERLAGVLETADLMR